MPVLIIARSKCNFQIMTAKPLTRVRLVPELLVTDIATSLRFWCGVLGFAVKYARPDEGFAYLEMGGAEVMLEQRTSFLSGRDAAWETGTMERPFGRIRWFHTSKARDCPKLTWASYRPVSRAPCGIGSTCPVALS